MFKIRKINYFEFLIIINFIFYATYTVMPKILPYNYILLGIIGLIYMYKNNINMRVCQRELYFILIVILGILSLSYSINKVEGFQKIVALLIFYFSIYKYMYNKIDSKYIYNAIKTSIVVSILYLLVCYFTYDYFLYNNMIYRGTTENQHNSAVILSITFIFLFINLFYTKNKLYLMTTIASLIYILYLQVHSFARVGFVIIGAYLFILLLYEFSKSSLLSKIKYIFLSVFILLIVFIGLYDIIMDYFSDFISFVDKKGFSGRDLIIYFILDKLNESIVFLFSGYGIGAVYTNFSELGIGLKDAGAIFSILFEGGIILLLIYLLLFSRYFYILYIIYKNKNIPKYIKYFLTIPAALILDFTDAIWISYSTFETILMFVGIVMTEKIYYLNKVKH